MALNDKEPNDKDHYANKRVRLAGDLIEDLFRVSSGQLARDLKYQLERHHNRKRELKITSCLRPDVLSSKILHALATGNWVGGRSGVSQLLDRTTYLASLSHMRRVTSPLVRSQPHFEARDLHPTQWGRLCPNETPEGQNCGLVKNAAQMVDISEEVDPHEVRERLDELDVYQPDDWTDGDRVHVNGDIYGMHKKGKNLVNHFKNARRRGTIPSEVSIRHDLENRDIFINTDKGRILRPLLVLYDGTPRLENHHLVDLAAGNITFKDLVNDGIVEWVDAEEEEDLYIAPRPFVLPETVPEGKFSGRPVTHEKIRWANLGQPGESNAILKQKFECQMVPLKLLSWKFHSSLEQNTPTLKSTHNWSSVFVHLSSHTQNTTQLLVLLVVLQWSSNHLVCQAQTTVCAQTLVLTSCTTHTALSSVQTQ